ncbi:MAG: UDP-glucose/GDP-mannose dehydrogenase family protein [Actinomycetales bacterium]|nr:UDP-glucose/GDP-mannose dehydrogenase family protein [Actinomycetales bacterium]
MRMSVIGCGYLGATHAACMADLGHEVIGIDVDPAKIEKLNSGEVPFYEPGLDEVLQRALASGRLRFTTSWDEVAQFADAHFLCVGTPQRAGSYAADMQYVDAAIAELAPRLTRPSLVIGKSTVPAGTAARLAEYLEQHAPVRELARLAWNPEFLREGFAVEDTVTPDRLVYGVADEESAAILAKIYEPVTVHGMPVIITTRPTAELVKVAANSFLATKISFINAMAEICEVAGGDVSVLADAIGHDTRIGRRFLNAGVGFGGGCLPKDIRAFQERVGELGVSHAVDFLNDIDAINLRRRQRVVDLALASVGGSFAEKTVAVLGAAFKPDSDDVRDSPALDIAASISNAGATVRVYDPKAMDNAALRFPKLDYSPTVADAVSGADVLLHLTEWREFRELDPASLTPLVRNPHIIDGRLCLDPARWRAAGWTYEALGRPTV